jgi:hypothetical protein
VKIYACIKATPNSNNVKINKIKIGNKLIKEVFPKKTITQLNPTITFNKVCPAIIFANKRTDKLTNLKLYEITSIGIISKLNKIGHPEGINKFKKYAIPFLSNNVVIILINKANAIKNVFVRALVKVLIYGIIP